MFWLDGLNARYWETWLSCTEESIEHITASIELKLPKKVQRMFRKGETEKGLEEWMNWDGIFMGGAN